MFSKELIAISSSTKTVSIDDVLMRANELAVRSRFEIERINLSDSTQWIEKGNIVSHKTGKFFSVEALYQRIGNTKSYLKPILNQPEIGYLGIICSKIDGVLKFLLQFKVEPGNLNIVQLSPTLQATKSNFSKVHGGTMPSYFEYFNKSDQIIIADSLQTEQGEYFFHKRNRNIIIYEESLIRLEENFIWLSLKDIYELMKLDDLINMDTRTVLALLNRSNSMWDISTQSKYNQFAMTNYSYSFLGGLESANSGSHIIAEDDNIIIGMYKIKIIGREVANWDQPLLLSKRSKEFSLIFRHDKNNGVLFALSLKKNYGIDKAVEFSGLEVQLQDLDFRDKFTFKLSEEGGRFYKMSNNYNIIEATHQFKSKEKDLIWVTYDDLYQIIINGFSSMELRTLKLCYDAYISSR